MTTNSIQWPTKYCNPQTMSMGIHRGQLHPRAKLQIQTLHCIQSFQSIPTTNHQQSTKSSSIQSTISKTIIIYFVLIRRHCNTKLKPSTTHMIRNRPNIAPRIVTLYSRCTLIPIHTPNHQQAS